MMTSAKFLLPSLAWLWALGAAAQDSSWTVSSGFDYSSGKYGLSRSTETLYIPLTFRYEGGPWTFRATVPYVETRGPAGVVGRGADRIPLGSPRGSTGRASGLGDVILGSAWTVFAGEGMAVDLGAKAKLATGDDKVGLSTGRNDYSLQGDFYRSLGGHTLFSSLGRRWMGDPQGVDFRDPYYLSLGWSFPVTPAVTTGLSYDYRQRLLPGSAPVREATAFLSWKPAPGWKIQTYGVAGFSRASPDWGLGILLFHSP